MLAHRNVSDVLGSMFIFVITYLHCGIASSVMFARKFLMDSSINMLYSNFAWLIMRSSRSFSVLLRISSHACRLISVSACSPTKVLYCSFSFLNLLNLVSLESGERRLVIPTALLFRRPTRYRVSSTIVSR